MEESHNQKQKATPRKVRKCILLLENGTGNIKGSKKKVSFRDVPMDTNKAGRKRVIDLTEEPEQDFQIKFSKDYSNKNYHFQDRVDQEIELTKDRYDNLNTCFTNSNPMTKEDFKTQVKRAKKSSDLTFKKSKRIQKKVEKPTTLTTKGANSTLMEQSVARLITIHNEKLAGLLIDDLLMEIVTQLNHFEDDIGKRGMEEEIVHFAKDFLKELEDLTETQKRLLVPGYETGYHPVSL